MVWWLLCVVKGWTLGEAGELVGQESHRKQGRFCWCGFFVWFVSFMNCSERFDPVTPLRKFMLTNQMWFRSGKTTGILCSFCYQASLRHPWQSTRTPLSICRCVTCFEKPRWWQNFWKSPKSSGKSYKDGTSNERLSIFCFRLCHKYLKLSSSRIFCLP